MTEKNGSSLMEKVISLSKQRGFVFQSSEIYGGLKSAYDYGPLGVELKRNIMNEWWRSMVHEREDVIGIDASIIMHSKVWEASGHLAGFSDPLVDCLISKERFRADKAPRPKPGDELPITCADKGQAKIYLEVIEKRLLPYPAPSYGLHMNPFSFYFLLQTDQASGNDGHILWFVWLLPVLS